MLTSPLVILFASLLIGVTTAGAVLLGRWAGRVWLRRPERSHKDRR